MESPSTTEAESPAHGTIPISCELRDRIRVAKAREGMTYDEYLRAELSLTD
jgi:hypothetical protein